MGQPEALGFGVKWEGTAEYQHFPRYSPLPLGLALTGLSLTPELTSQLGVAGKGNQKSYPANEIIGLEAGHPGPTPDSAFWLLVSPSLSLGADSPSPAPPGRHTFLQLPAHH